MHHVALWISETYGNVVLEKQVVYIICESPLCRLLFHFSALLVMFLFTNNSSAVVNQQAVGAQAFKSKCRIMSFGNVDSAKQEHKPMSKDSERPSIDGTSGFLLEPSEWTLPLPPFHHFLDYPLDPPILQSHSCCNGLVTAFCINWAMCSSSHFSKISAFPVIPIALKTLSINQICKSKYSAAL